MRNFILSVAAIATLTFTGCVPGRIHDELKAKYDGCVTERDSLNAQNKSLKATVNEKTDEVTELNKKVTDLKRDTTIMGNTLRKITNNYEQLNKTYDLLLQKNKELLEGSERDTKSLTGQLFTTQKDLQMREDSLNKMSAELAAKERRLGELQDILDRKDSTVNALKKIVTDALVGFNNNGLTVEMRNGKVYVSMDESLLFASGSSKIDTKGAEAIKKLAQVLAENPDINVMVEGHTDDVPMKGSGEIKDNWDLSVMRATTVAKLLISSANVNPTRITASGHGEFLPIAIGKTPEARKKNRRTEIILTPKLDELFKVIESN